MTVTPFSTLTLEDAPAVISPAIITLNCELVRGTEDQVTRELLPRVQQHSVILDLSGVERIDAAGIATLITLYCTAMEAGHTFRVADPSCHVLELLRLVGLEEILVEKLSAAAAKSTCPERNARYTRPAA